MLSRTNDPIVAVATAPGRGAVGIVRVSGARLAPLIHALFGRALSERKATYLPFRDAQGEVIDRGLAILFPAPHSFTGEDVLELQAHGGAVVLQLLVARCLEAALEIDAASGLPRLPHLRVAQPGEFSQRAFLNGKIDLAQAEAIADLIDASTEAAVRSASRSLSGEFSREIHMLRDALVNLRMLVEATLDFPVAALRTRARQGALLREGIKVVISGQPNAGKSSLLNALAGAELAIVSAVPGTTRDVVSQTIQIHGVPLHVADTAGLRDSTDEVEKIGVARAWGQIEGADAVLFLHDLTRTDTDAYAAADLEILRGLQVKLSSSTPVVDVWSKLDAVANPQLRPGIMLSAKTGVGVEALRDKLLEVAGWQAVPEGIFLARARHVQALERVSAHLAIANEHLLARAQLLDLLAEELRLAQNSLNEITGEFGADDLLGVIFSRFCIGK